MLLDTLARTNDPNQAIKMAFERRAERRNTLMDAQRRGVEQSLSPSRILNRGDYRPRSGSHPRSLPSLGAARPPPPMPAEAMRPAPDRFTGSRVAGARGASRPSSARPSSAPRPMSAGRLHTRLPPRMSMPDRLRRTVSREPTRVPPQSVDAFVDSSHPAQNEASADPAAKQNAAKRGRLASNAHILRQNKARDVKARDSRRALSSVFSR